MTRTGGDLFTSGRFTLPLAKPELDRTYRIKLNKPRVTDFALKAEKGQNDDATSYKQPIRQAQHHPCHE